jgi:membrane-bound lytic murein transglycosylase A
LRRGKDWQGRWNEAKAAVRGGWLSPHLCLIGYAKGILMKTPRFSLVVALLAAGLAGCATVPAGPAPSSASTPSTPPEITADFALVPDAYALMPGWAEADLGPALTAFQSWCGTMMRRAPDQALSRQARYGGVVGDWLPACRAAAGLGAQEARLFFEVHFAPSRVLAGVGESRLTAYFEPVVDARRAPEAGFTEPFLTPPADMVTVDLAGFAAAYDNEALRGAPRELRGILLNGRVRPYPQRGSLPVAPGQAFAYAHPADLYKVQVQGSGRLRFDDGTEVRAAFAAQNGYRWRSALGAARDSGYVRSPTWSSFRAYLDDQGPEGVRAALNADPSYVFFDEEPISDPLEGPRGAAGVALTPLASIAIDPAFHPYGALLFVKAAHDRDPFARLLLALDTGGAIRRGPLRGDVFWGTGAEAGQAAERMNAAEVAFWTLLPRALTAAAGDRPEG